MGLVFIEEGIEYSCDEMWPHLEPLARFAKENNIFHDRRKEKKGLTVFHFEEVLDYLNCYGGPGYRVAATILESHCMSLRFQRYINGQWDTETTACLEFVGWLTHTGAKRPAEEVGWFISA